MMEEAGAGGDWPRAREKPDASVVCQYERYACGPACAQMLLANFGVVVEQRMIAEACGTPVGTKLLAQVMRELAERSGGWAGGRVVGEGISPSTILNILCSTGSWAALLWESGTRIGHMVVIDGLSDDGQRVRIRDPWPPGTTYTMSRADFLEYWNEEGILRRG